MSTKESFNFKIESSVVEQLGRNLYSNDNSIIIELIANSYDAQASSVSIIFGPDFIKVSDDGYGMSTEDLKNKFLTVGIKKRENNKTGDRPFLGRKGIGKLSVFALGSQVFIETRKNNGANIINTTTNLDYNNLLDNKNELNLNITKMNLNNSKPGTDITITDLIKKNPSNKSIENIIISISRIFSKILSQNNDMFKIKIKIHDLKIKINKEIILEKKEYLIMKTNPNFEKVGIFFSLDKKTDSLIEKIEIESEQYFKNFSEITGLKKDKFSYYLTSDKVKLFLNKKNIKIDDELKIINRKNTRVLNKKIELKGYLAAVVNLKSLKGSQSNVQKNDSIKVNNTKKELLFSPANRKITISSRGRVGDFHLKEKLNLADKFYIKYLFGEIECDDFENDNYIDMASPSRESYIQSDVRWNFMKKIVSELGNEAMNFLNSIPKEIIKIDGKNFLNERNKMEDRTKVFVSKLSNNNDKLMIKDYLSRSISQISELKVSGNIGDKTPSKFILISYRGSKNLEGAKQTESVQNFSSKKRAIILENIFRDLKITKMNVKILCTASNDEEFKPPKGRDLFVLIKKEMYKEEYRYRTFHLFSCLSVDYPNNWNTAIEYGMGYANSELSEDNHPSNITHFVNEFEKDQINHYSLLNFDVHIEFNAGNILRELNDLFNKWYINIDKPILKKTIKKYFK